MADFDDIPFGEPVEQNNFNDIPFGEPVNDIPFGQPINQDELTEREKLYGTISNVEPSFFEEYISNPAKRGQARLKQIIELLTTDKDDDKYIFGTRMADLGRQYEAAGMSEQNELGMQAIAESKGFVEAGKAIKDNPGAVFQTVVESLSLFFPALGFMTVAGATGLPGAVPVSAFLGSGTTEYGASFMEQIKKTGGDPMDARAWANSLQDDEIVNAARKYATKRGLAIGTFDAVTAGLAGKLMIGSKGGIVSPTLRSGGEVGVQATGGGFGEATAQLVTEGKLTSPGEILLEAVAEVPTGAIEVPLNIRNASNRSKLDMADTIEKVTSTGSVDDAIDAAEEILDQPSGELELVPLKDPKAEFELVPLPTPSPPGMRVIDPDTGESRLLNELHQEISELSKLDVQKKEAFEKAESEAQTSKQLETEQLLQESKLPAALYSAETEDQILKAAGELDTQPTSMELALEKAQERLTPTPETAQEEVDGLTTVKSGDLGTGIKSNKAVEEYKKAILETKKVMPISISKDGFIVDGEHRYKALMELGVTDIPVFVGEQLGSSGKLKEGYSGISVDINLPASKTKPDTDNEFSSTQTPLPETLSNNVTEISTARTSDEKDVVEQVTVGSNRIPGEYAGDEHIYPDGSISIKGFKKRFVPGDIVYKLSTQWDEEGEIYTTDKSKMYQKHADSLADGSGAGVVRTFVAANNKIDRNYIDKSPGFKNERTLFETDKSFRAYRYKEITETTTTNNERKAAEEIDSKFGNKKPNEQELTDYLLNKWVDEDELKVGGFLHLDDSVVMTDALVNAIKNWQILGGRIGKTAGDKYAEYTNDYTSSDEAAFVHGIARTEREGEVVKFDHSSGKDKGLKPKPPGKKEEIEGKKTDVSKEPWQMTGEEWAVEREKARPNTAQSNYTKASKSEAESNIKRLEELLYGVSNEASEKIKQAQKEEIELTQEELELYMDRINTPVLHRDVIEKALSEGKNVSDNIVNEYPELRTALKQRTVKDTKPTTGLSVQEVEKVLSPEILAVNEKVGLNLKVVAGHKDLPARVQSKIKPGELMAGVMDGNTVYIVASNNVSEKEAIITYSHEVVGHVGMEAVVGEGWSDVIKQINRLNKLGNERYKTIMDEVHDRYGTDLDEKTEIQEFIALAVEQQVKEGAVGKLIKKIRQAIRKFLKSIGITRILSDADLDSLIQKSRDYLKTGKVDKAKVKSGTSLFSKGTEQPVYYSAALKSVRDMQQKKGTPQQFIKAMEKAGVKKEEIDWLDIAGFMEGKASVTKDELIDFINANEVHVMEVEKDDIPYETGSVPDKWATKFKSYQLPGAKEGTYRELLLTLPELNKVEYTEDNVIEIPFGTQDVASNENLWYFDVPGNVLQISKTRHPTIEDAKAYVIRDKQPEASLRDNFQGGHYDELNILAHIRFNERTDADGKKVLFLEEIQSDLHQKGRKHGYKGNTTGWKAQDTISLKNGIKLYAVSDATGELMGNVEAKSPNEAISIVSKNTSFDQYSNQPPDAPFKKSWPLLTMKRMIRYAVDNGFDSVAWTTGEQQADRYDLSKQISDITYVKNEKDNTYDVSAHRKVETVWSDGKATLDVIENTLGKEIRKKIEEGKGVKGVDDKGTRSLSGLDLKVGGEGMKAFYDNILPNMVNKYVKKFGGKVDETTIGATRQPDVYTYTGSDYTLEQLEEAYTATHSSRNEYVSPLTGETLDYAVNRVVNSGSMGLIMSAVHSGKSLKQAIEDNGPDITPSFVEDIFGGILKRDEVVTDATVHSLPITDKMREAAQQGQPLFSKKKVDVDPPYVKRLKEKQAKKKEPVSQPEEKSFKFFNTNRKYTPEQEAVIKKGGFGKKPPMAKFGDRWDGFRNNLGTKVRQGLVDQYASFKNILKDPQTWMMANLSSSSNGALEMLLEAGSPHLKGNVISINTKDKSLRQIFDPLDEEMDDWLMWVAGNRAEKLMAEGRENLFTQDDITSLKSLADGKTKDGKSRRLLYGSVRKDFEKMNAAVNNIAVKSGLLTEKEATVWEEQGFYLPFYRMVGDQSDARGPRVFSNGLIRQVAYKKLKGADLQIGDLLGNALMNWNHLIGASLKNNAGVRALEQAEILGLAREVGNGKKKSKDAVYVRKNGKEVWYEIDGGADGALVLDSLMSLNYDGLNTRTMKIARGFKRVLTMGVTASPEFKAANLFRDSIQAIAVADMSTNIAKNLYQGWNATSKGNDTIIQMISGGGAFGDSGYIHGADPDAIRSLVKKGVLRDSILTRRKLLSWWDKYQDFGARLENVNRAANFVQDMEGDKSLLESNFNAKDHLDFSRTGSFTAIRVLAQTVPFLNARLQGLDKLGRAAMDKNQRIQFATVVSVYTLVSVALYLAMKDDDDYKHAEEWERDSYHLFKLPGSDIMYRLPRPFEVGAIASTAERMVEQIVDDDVHGQLFAERLWHTITETFAFNPIPQVAKPVLEVYANKNSFTGRNIESIGMRLANLPAEDRKRAWTSATAIEASGLMNKISWGKVVLSPVQIEHLVRAYLGWAGATSLDISDYITREVTDAAERPKKHWTNTMLIKRFAREADGRASKYLTNFYEHVNELNEIQAAIKQAREWDDVEKAMDLEEKNKSKLQWRIDYNRLRIQLSELRGESSRIHLNKTLSPALKKLKIDRLNHEQKRLAKLLEKQAKDVF